MKIKYFLLALLSFLAFYSSSSMLYLFYEVWTRGRRLLYEPNITILTVETALVTIGFIVNIGLIAYFMMKMMEKKEQKMADEN